MVCSVMGISVLGPLRLSVGDRQVPLPAKQAILLAILALQPHRTVSTDRLIEALWGEDASPDLVKTLQTHVFQLRRRLEPGAADVEDRAAIVTEGHGYRLEAGPSVVDASVFLALVSEARSASVTQPEHAVDLLSEALALWRGPDVAEVGGEPAATAEIERLQEVRTSAVDELVRVRLGLGETDALIADLRKAVSEAPYREQLWASLMLALARSGQRAQALLAYRDAEAALRRELDVEPSRDLQELAARIRDEDPSLANGLQAGGPGITTPANEAAIYGDSSETLGGGRGPVPARRSRRFVPVIALGAAAIAATFLVGRGWMDRTTPQATVVPTGGEPSVADLPEVHMVADSLAVMDETGRVIRNTKVGALPDGVVEAEGSLWVVNTTDDEVTRIDAATLLPIDAISVGAGPTSLATGFGAVWVANNGDRTVSRINASTGDVVSTPTVGMAPYGIVTDDKWVWVTNMLDGTLSRIDPLTDHVDSFPLGRAPLGVTSAGGVIWVADYEAGDVVRVDPDTGDVIDRITVGNGPTSIAADGEHLWVVDADDGTLARVDPVSRAVKQKFELGGDPGALAVRDGVVWVAVASPPAMVRVDPPSGAPTRFPLEGSPQSVWLAAGGPVITIRGVPTAHHGGTLRLVSRELNFPSLPDPALDFDVTGTLTLLTNDGLLGFRRVGGPMGTTIVPDLAAAMPSVSPDGLRYVFRLRSNLKFSTGAPVRPSDVVRSIERATSLGGAGGLFDAIVGAPDCRDAQPCDLGEGIVADDEAQTVTFLLTQRDPYFLDALAQVPAQVVPANTPFGEQTTWLPATGPYMFERFDADRIKLVRNPLFDVWSTAAQPDGYPDEIEWFHVPNDSDPSEVVEAGKADLVADPRALTRDRVHQLATKYPAQLQADPGRKVYVEIMNTTVPPFDDPDVRFAVSLAVDRDAVLEAWGGPIQGRITCQVVPPTLPGYSPYCPFTVSPDPSGKWHAADIDLARRLIDEAGAFGEPVTVYGSSGPGHAQVAEYMVGLLNRLGFKAKLHLVDPPDYFGGPYLTADHPADLGMAGTWWGVGPTAASQFVGAFTCPGYAGIPDSGAPPSDWCDPEVDRLVTAAMALDAAGNRAEANQTWQEVDRRVTNAAPVAAILNPADTTFVSSRVGNFQHHMIWWYLIDQMWVR
jgi:peptide/nickel transport system substrate-binding protein